MTFKAILSFFFFFVAAYVLLSRFRECAARALLLPRRDPGRRAPLWQQRQRSAQLLAVAARYPSFPIILETVREVLQDSTTCRRWWPCTGASPSVAFAWST